MRTNLYIDLDDTLLDNAAVKQKISSLIELIGIDPNHKPDGFSASKQITGFYTPHSHLAYLEANPEQVALFEAYWLAEAENLKDLLFPGAIQFLEAINRDRYTPILLTLGDPAYQEFKVVNLDIVHYFEAVHITDRLKHLYLQDLQTSLDRFYLIDDRADCRELVSQQFPKATTFASFAEAEL